jgi:hypothetical protein
MTNDSDEKQTETAANDNAPAMKGGRAASVKRAFHLIERLRGKGFVPIATLMAEMGVSDRQVRRDLDVLAAVGQRVVVNGNKVRLYAPDDAQLTAAEAEALMETILVFHLSEPGLAKSVEHSLAEVHDKLARMHHPWSERDDLTEKECNGLLAIIVMLVLCDPRWLVDWDKGQHVMSACRKLGQIGAQSNGNEQAMAA